MDEIGDAIGERSREIRAEVEGAIFTEASRDINTRIAFADGELYVRVTLVVTKKDVVARLLLLDEVVFEGEGLALVVDDDVFYIDGLAKQGTGLGVGHGGFDEVRAYPGSKALGLADINDLPLGVLI